MKRFAITVTTFCLVAVFGMSLTARAEFVVPEGYTFAQIPPWEIPPIPGFIGGMDYLTMDTQVYFDGEMLTIFSLDVFVDLFDPPGTVWGSFVKVGPAPDDLIYMGETSNNLIYEVTQDGDVREVGTIAFSHDLEFDGQTAYISHNPGGYGTPENRVSLIDLDTGELDEILVTDSWSGPHIFDGEGSLYYCRPSVDFFTPGGSIYLFDSGQVASAAGPTALSLEDGLLLTDELTGCYDMALADTTGDQGSLFVGTGNMAEVQVERFDLATGEVTPFITDPAEEGWSTYVRFWRGTDPFLPYEKWGGKLMVNQADKIYEVTTDGGCFIESIR